MKEHGMPSDSRQEIEHPQLVEEFWQQCGTAAEPAAGGTVSRGSPNPVQGHLFCWHQVSLSLEMYMGRGSPNK